MLPSKQRLSRSEFKEFLGYKDLKVVFNNIGTLKYKKSLKNQFSVVISSKQEKRAVFRNKLRRRLYSLFEVYIKESNTPIQAILYCSKQSNNLKFNDIKTLFNELFKKITK